MNVFCVQVNLCISPFPIGATPASGRHFVTGLPAEMVVSAWSLTCTEEEQRMMVFPVPDTTLMETLHINLGYDRKKKQF